MSREQGSDGRRRLGYFAVDLGELAEGYQFDGRGRAIQLWRERKEARAFSALCNKLRVMKRYRRIMAEGPGSPRYESFRARCRAWAREHREYETARVKAWRLQQRIASALVIACPVCGSTWCPVPTRGTGRFAVYCSPACKRRSRTKAFREARTDG